MKKPEVRRCVFCSRFNAGVCELAHRPRFVMPTNPDDYGVFKRRCADFDEAKRPAIRPSSQPCAHPRPVKVGAVMDGAADTRWDWCSLCGAIRRSGTYMPARNWDWLLPESAGWKR